MKHIRDDGPRICGFCKHWVRDSYDVGRCVKRPERLRVVSTKSTQFCNDFEELA